VLNFSRIPMSSFESVKQNIEEIKTLKSIANVFSDIAAYRINRLKSRFERNIEFFEQMTQLYHSIKISAIYQKARKKGKIKPTILHPRTVHIALTSNRRFYGTINRDVMDAFLDQVNKSREDGIVIGLTGKELITLKYGNNSYEFIIFKEDSPSHAERSGLLEKIKSYDRVFVYYPQFINMLTQHVTRIDIAYAPEPVALEKKELRMIFEPELLQIIAFFDQQIRTILFDRITVETELARMSRRLVVTDTAEKQAGRILRLTQADLHRAYKASVNRSIIETVSRLKRGRIY